MERNDAGRHPDFCVKESFAEDGVPFRELVMDTAKVLFTEWLRSSEWEEGRKTQ